MKLSNQVGRLSLFVAAIISFANAASCTFDAAIPWESESDSDDYASTIGAEIAAEGEENALGLIGKRAAIDLECDSSEVCIAYTSSTLLCADATTGDFHDNFDGTGNLFTGEYTGSSGDVGTTSNSADDDDTVAGGVTGSTTCSQDVALPVSADASSTGSGIDASIQASSNYAAVNAIGDRSSSSKRASANFECTPSETCIFYGATVLLCLEPISGDFHDEYDGNGNAYSGDYTASNGETQSITGTMLPTPPATGTAAHTTATPSDGTKTHANSSSTTSGGSAPSSSSQTSGAAAEQANGAAQEAGPRALVLVAVALLGLGVVPLIAL